MWGRPIIPPEAGGQTGDFYQKEEQPNNHQMNQQTSNDNQGNWPIGGIFKLFLLLVGKILADSLENFNLKSSESFKIEPTTVVLIGWEKHQFENQFKIQLTAFRTAWFYTTAPFLFVDSILYYFCNFWLSNKNILEWNFKFEKIKFFKN